MIIVVYGTTGELIKLAPVLRRLEERGLSYLALSTHQQAQQIRPMCQEFGLRPPDVVLSSGYRGKDLSESWHLVVWLTTVVLRFAVQVPRLRRRLAAEPGRHHLLVHGDTVTTVVGALMGRVLRLPVGHVEAGLRSHDWRNPFPEELDRRAVARLAGRHYAPNETAVSNLVGASGAVIPTGANTVCDSLGMVPTDVLDLERHLGRPLPSEPFGIVSIHRFELLAQEARLRALLEVLAAHAQQTPLIFIDHPVTVAKLQQYGLDNLFDDKRFVRVPRQGYLPFITLLRLSEFLVTDSGGAQEESFYLGQPCLVHRLEVERSEGLGQNVLLSRFDLEEVGRFLRSPSAFRIQQSDDRPSPSDIIVQDLLDEGAWAARD